MNAVGGCSQFFGAGSADGLQRVRRFSRGDCFPPTSPQAAVCNFASGSRPQARHPRRLRKLVRGGRQQRGRCRLETSQLCTGDLTPLCTDINGVPRPTTRPWNAGAFGLTLDQAKRSLGWLAEPAQAVAVRARSSSARAFSSAPASPTMMNKMKTFCTNDSAS